MKKLIIISILIISTSGCSIFKGDSIAYFKPELAGKEQSNYDLILGKWYGENKVENGETREFIEERNDDGTYAVEFHTIDKTGKVSIQKEFGEWGISGKVIFTFVKSIQNHYDEQATEMGDPMFQDAYIILNLSPTVCTYKHVVSGEKFTVRKVDSQFTFSK